MVKGLIYQNEEHLRNFLRKFKCEEDVVEIMVELFNNHLDGNKKLISLYKDITYSITKSEERVELFKKVRLFWNNYKETNKFNGDLLLGEYVEEEFRCDTMKVGWDYKYITISEEYNAPSSCGVYFLYDENKELKYIGKSTSLYSRILSSTKERQTVYARYIEMKTEADTHIMEMYFINKFKPILNSDGKALDDITFNISAYDDSLLSEFTKVYDVLGKVEDFDNPLMIKTKIRKI